MLTSVPETPVVRGRKLDENKMLIFGFNCENKRGGGLSAYSRTFLVIKQTSVCGRHTCPLPQARLHECCDLFHKYYSRKLNVHPDMVDLLHSEARDTNSS